jgi:mercuric reductase
MPTTYDLIIIGSGSGGFAAASVARKCGVRRILFIEKRAPGYSLCTNYGCMPSKTLIASAEVKRVIENAREFGIQASKPKVQWKQVQSRVCRLVEKDFFAARKEAILGSKIEIIKGEGQFTGQNTVQVNGAVYSAQKIIIATGSVVNIPLIKGLQETGFIDSDKALYLKELPKSLAIIGGGYIAVEIGVLFHSMGVKVTIIQRGARILDRLDQDISEELQKLLIKSGMQIITKAQIKSVQKSGAMKQVAIRASGQTKILKAQEIMVATGRKPAIDGLCLENAGVFVNDRSAIAVNEYLQTNKPHIYAVGDVNGLAPLVYVASMEGRIAGMHTAGAGAKPVDYNLVGSVIFSHPEIGVVGLTKKEAEAKGLKTITAITRMKDIGKAVALGQMDGFVKMVAEKPSGKILGLHILGAHATDIMQVALPHLYHNDTVFDILNIPYPHPTLGEAISYPAEEIADKLRA